MMQKNKSVVRGVTLIFMVFVLFTEIAWARIEAHNSNHKEAVNEFLNYFPSFLRNTLTITYLTLLCAVIAIVFAFRWIKMSARIERVIAIIFLLQAIFSTLLMLFQLM